MMFAHALSGLTAHEDTEVPARNDLARQNAAGAHGAGTRGAGEGGEGGTGGLSSGGGDGGELGSGSSGDGISGSGDGLENSPGSLSATGNEGAAGFTTATAIAEGTAGLTTATATGAAEIAPHAPEILVPAELPPLAPHVDERATGTLDATSEETEIARELDAYEELIGPINPNFNPFDLSSPYASNCGSCAIACWERLSGANPEAVATPVQIGTRTEMDALTGMHQTPTTPAEILARAQEAGPGYHAIVGFDWSGADSGHWINVATSVTGRVYALDSQVGHAMLFTDYLQAVATPEETENWDVSL